MASHNLQTNDDCIDETVTLGRLRTDCPVCGGSNSFSATYLPATFQVVYNCFKADCDNKGASFVGLNKTTQLGSLFTVQDRKPTAKETKEFLPTDSFIEPEYSKEAISYLQRVQCYSMHKEKHIKVKYDLKLNRVVFLVEDCQAPGKIINAVGRTLYKRGLPKWYKYTDQPSEYIVGSGSTAVIVEDIPSACVVSTLDGFVGIALSGTTLSPTLERYLINKNFNKLLVCLDKDAALKSMSMCATLKHKVPGVSVLFPDIDIKNMDDDTLEDFLS